MSFSSRFILNDLKRWDVLDELPWSATEGNDSGDEIFATVNKRWMEELVNVKRLVHRF